MRDIITISLPKSLSLDINKAVKANSYASKSEFFRELVRDWKERQILNNLRYSQLEVSKGKGKKLKSLKDLR